jgi:hypothetical protein
MTGAAISQQVLQFVAEQIDTVPQLECLLLLYQHRSRIWIAEEVAARIYISPQVAREILEMLHRRELIAAEGDPPRYRFHPGGAASDELIGQVAGEYQRHLVPLATFIHSKAPASVREFARAFDLKKER